jgi:hypothetical protein
VITKKLAMKTQYRIRNWSEYNAGLKQMGNQTFWIEESVLEQWVVEELSGKPGVPPPSIVTLRFKRWRP